MAKQFDKQRAATDLKQLLKMNDKSKSQEPFVQSDAAHSKSTTGQHSNNFEAESRSSSGKFSNTHANSNGNALLTAVTQNQSVSLALKQGNETDAGGCDDMADNSKGQQGNHNKSKNLKKVKNVKKSKSAGLKNPDVSSNLNQVNSLVPNKNSSVYKGENKHDERIKEGAEISSKTQQFQNGNRVSDNSIQRDGQYQGMKRGDVSSYIMNTKLQHLKLGEPDIPSEFLMLMEENRIHLLKKRSSKFPKAKFFCRLCDYHMELQEDCDKHMKDSKHSRRKEINAVDAKLKTLPKPTEEQIAALTTAVDKVYEEHGITEKEQEQRAAVVARLEKMLQQRIPDVMMFMYGSSLTGFGLKTADINVNLSSTSANKKLTTLLLEVHENLITRTDCGFSGLRSDFNAKVPGLLLTDDHSGWTVHVVIHCYSAHCSSELLSIYSNFDVRVRKLAVAFRYWAHTCGLEGQQEEFIPAQALNLMVIYFLQHITPQVVPIVQPPKVSGEDVGDFRKDFPKFQKMRAKVVNVKLERSNSMSVGDLWLRLLKYYSLEFDACNAVVSIRSSQDVARTIKPWNNKKLAVEDPYMLKRNITRAVCNSSLYEYWQDSIRRALSYFGLPRNSADKKYIHLQERKKAARESKRISQPVDVRGKYKESDADTFVHGDKMKTVDSVQADSLDSDKRDLPDEKEQTDEKDCRGPVVIAPNPLLLGRVSHPGRADRLQSVPHTQNKVQISDCPSQDKESSNISALGPVVKTPSDDSNIQGHNSAAFPDIASHDHQKTQPVVASDTTIPSDHSSIVSSHQSSLVTSLEQLSVHSSENRPAHVSLPQPLCNVDSSEKAADDTLCPILPDDVNISLQERKQAQSPSCACESNTDNGGVEAVAQGDAEDAQSPSCACESNTNNGGVEAVAQGGAGDVAASCCKELLNKFIQPSSVPDTSSSNTDQAKDADSNVQSLQIKPAEPSDKFSSDLASKEQSDKFSSEFVPKEPSDKLSSELSPKELSDKFSSELSPKEHSDKFSSELSSKEPSDKFSSELSSKEPSDKFSSELSPKEQSDKFSSELSSKEPSDKFSSELSSKEPSDKFSSELSSKEPSDKFSSELASKVASADRADAKGERTVEQKDPFSMDGQSGCHYEFSRESLTDGKGPTLMCTFCDKEGHLKNDCPDNNLPEILPLPALTPFHITVLSETLSKVPAEVGLSEEGLAEREIFMRGLEAFIQVQFTDARLSLFGSSCNGFGFDKSDMDICLTFTQRKIGDKVMVIESLARKMKQHMELTNVQSIPTAKVPIVKFTVKKSGLEGDISLYNTLAEQNTKLLLCYNKIDPRVNILGYAIKTFAKVCDIGDASRGSLSSYAYVLMMLYYLQQVTPPVIPVLQELYKGDQKPQLLVEGWDAWFQNDLSLLDELWPEKGKNEMSVAELWLGFLCFYVEEFKYKEHVVSIRQKQPLTRFEKLWNGPCIAIEDPFDLSHNLGSALTRTMNNFIFKTFINGRMLYGSPIDENMDMFNKYQRPSDYFFDTDLLSECRPPNVRGCRRCGKVGHLVRHCPATLKDKEDEQKRLQQQLQQQKQLQQQRQVQQDWSNSSQQQQHSKRPQQQQQQQQRQSQPQRIPPPQVQQQRNNVHVQQQNERDVRDRRELDRRQNDPNANINRNASAPSALGHNYKLPLEAPVPVEMLNRILTDMSRLMLAPSANSQPTFPNSANMTASGSFQGLLHTPAFRSNSLPQSYSHHQSGYRSSSPFVAVHPPPSVMQQYGRHNQSAVNFGPRASHNALYQQGYPQAPRSYGGWTQNNNNHNRRPEQFGSQYNSFGNNGGSANFQGMNPRVQNLFANATGQVLNGGTNQAHRRK